MVLLDDRCVIVGVRGGCTVSRASWEGVDAVVPEVPALTWVLSVKHEDGVLLDCGVHEDDHACAFPEFLRRVDEFMETLDASLAAVGSEDPCHGLIANLLEDLLFHIFLIELD